MIHGSYEINCRKFIICLWTKGATKKGTTSETFRPRTRISTLCTLIKGWELYDYDLGEREVVQQQQQERTEQSSQAWLVTPHHQQQGSHWWARQTAGTEYAPYVCTLIGPTQKTLASYQLQHQAPAASQSWRLLFCFLHVPFVLLKLVVSLQFPDTRLCVKEHRNSGNI